MPEIISSPQNPKIKNLKRLEKASERKAQNLFVIEGTREIVLAHRAGYEIQTLFICEELLRKDSTYDIQKVLDSISESRLFYTTQKVYESLAYRDTTEGLLAIVVPKTNTLQDLRLQKNPLILVIESVEKPGNLGAMLRTCDAAGVSAVIICDAKTDLYNPNCIRSSVGTVFTNQIAVCETPDAITFLKQNSIVTFAAELDTSGFYHEQDFNNPSAIVVGTEATGLSQAWVDAAAERIKIPMLGEIDSLNVSVSAGILLFEAVRQRTKK